SESEARRRGALRAVSFSKAVATNSSRFSFGKLEDQADSLREPLPVAGLSPELAASLGGEAIELCFAPGFRFAPLGRQEALVFEAMQGGIERALLHVPGDLLEALGNGVAVNGSDSSHREDQQVESALG